MLRRSERTLKGARSGGSLPQGAGARTRKEQKKKKKGPVLVFVAPCVASHAAWCHLTNGQLETEKQSEQLQPENQQLQRPGGSEVSSRTAAAPSLWTPVEQLLTIHYPGNNTFSPVFTASCSDAGFYLPQTSRQTMTSEASSLHSAPQKLIFATLHPASELSGKENKSQSVELRWGGGAELPQFLFKPEHGLSDPRRGGALQWWVVGGKGSSSTYTNSPSPSPNPNPHVASSAACSRRWLGLVPT